MLTEKIQNDLKESLKSRDQVKVSTLRILLAEINNTRIAKGIELADEDIISVIQKEVKKRKEAAEGFRSGGREESAQVEEQELAVLEFYLPAQLSDEELTKIVESTITEVGANLISDMGKVIGSVMGKVKGRADGARVSALVKQKLSS
ncbi:GatB/YqeY domain-containing protein [Candidatus Daviesbacteria bacterium]|nr:GatB/YqeY domain-containing protein [Candidatus Daviesbacteria bacterium]